MSPRWAVVIGVLYTGAVFAWMTGRLSSGAVATSTAMTTWYGLLLVQVLTVWLTAPWCARNRHVRDVLPPALIIVLMPAPVLVLIAQLSDISLVRILLSQLLVLTVAIAGSGLAWRLRSVLQTPVAVALFQFCPALMIWSGRNQWVGWVTG